MQHVIKKQIITLELDKRLDAFRVQQQVSAHYWKEIVPVLQKVFDSISSDDEVIVIDKLELNLGRLSAKSIEKDEWSAELAPILEKQLADNLPSATTTASMSRQSRSLNICGQWIYYIQNGYLPWNTLQPDDEWYNKVVEALATDFSSIQSLRHIIRSSSAALRRIVAQHPTDFLILLTEILTAKKQTGLPGLLDELYLLKRFVQQQEYNTSFAAEDLFKKDLWSKALILAASDEGRQATTLSPGIVQLFLQEQPLHEPLPADIISKLSASLPLIRDAGNTIPLKKKKEEATEIIRNDDKKSDKDELFVSYAGMVLLHPFLNTFFNRLSLVNENEFIDHLSRQKALYLLHYLVSGNTEAKEYELVMAKVLCAWEMHEPVDSGIIISEEERAEADELLVAVIQQWDILKNTSPDGLREGFLQRNGKLMFKNGGIYLQVEASSIDMLMDHLPWNLGIIKLPWMHELLRVEWR